MNAFPLIDMREVTRLTRAGKLADAMQLLRGGDSEPAAPSLDDLADAAPLKIAEALTRARRLISGFAPASEGFAENAPPSLREPEGARFETRTYLGATGSREYKVYAPSGAVGPLPVLVMLHGCTQDPDDFALGTRMNEVAEDMKFLVVYPRQPQSANMQKCWNWFDAREQRRDGGEPSDIAGIAREVLAAFSADPTRVYVAGLSAGGAAAANLAATYPDLFAAIGVHSGLACGAARDMSSAFTAMRGGGATAPRNGARVPTIVFHGDADKTVNPVNAERVVAQLGPKSGLTETASEGRTPAGKTYTRRNYADSEGIVVGEQWTLHGGGHAWSGGSAAGSYTDPKGPDASREIARFLLSHRRA